MSKTDELRLTFFQECEDLLESLNDGLTGLMAGAAGSEEVNAIFRAVHSIKGGAGAFGLDDIVRFSHSLENVLDALRHKELETTPEVLSILLRAADCLTTLVEAAQNGCPAETAPTDRIVADLGTLITPTETNPVSAIDFVPLAVDLQDIEDLSQTEKTYRIHFRPYAGLYTSGNETCFLLRDLRALGDAKVNCDVSKVPQLQDLDPNETHLAWDIELVTDSSELAIREVFEFIDGLCDLSIEMVQSQTAQPLALNPITPCTKAQIGTQALGKTEAASSDTLMPAPADPPRAPTSQHNTGSTIRVELHRIDRMINLVGELVINQAMLSQSIRQVGLANDCDVEVALEGLATLTHHIQDGVMAIRAQAIKPLFLRMSRIAREAGSDLGKTVNVVLEGAATEIDKTVVEKLADPLTHMIRNAVDHGLEDTETRIATGKNPMGTITLSARHQAGRVVIELSDDGPGIDHERVQSTAITKNLITADAQLTESEINDLIFRPGFSTVTELSNLSGRGVGMDVVNRAIQNLGGRVSIESRDGAGTTFTIVLPLTLAVLDGMIIGVTDQTMVIPLSAILETMRLDPKEVFQLGTDSTVVRIRGKYVPIVDVAEQLGFRMPDQAPDTGVLLLVAGADGTHAALLVDEIFDQRQVVIKGLTENYGDVDGIAAATILGDGRIALILDTAFLVAGSAAPKFDNPILTAAE